MRRRAGPLAGAVDRLLRGLGIADDVARVEAIDAWPSVAVAVLGPDAGTTRAVRIDGSTLVVTVPTSAWSAEIRLRESEIVAQLRAAAPRSGIVRVRPVPTDRPTAP